MAHFFEFEFLDPLPHLNSPKNFSSKVSNQLRSNKGLHFKRKRTLTVNDTRKSFSSPEMVRSDDAKVSLNNGKLEITLPKKIPKETKN